ncbi:MAG: hypothetical protein DRJ42_11245 [Deltaproteobacteria bacterium]|nr:MAG: hypothetical protein DRJ42_11245 [Deltaproteobacteria bacterium]
MKRVIIGVLVSTFLVGMFTVGADAQRRRRRQQREQVAPQSAEIAPALGELRWGMTRDEVYDHFVKQVRERYRPRLSKARDAMAEDNLRHQQREEVQRIRRSYVRFRGQTTGWDVSFLRDEFTHGNGEAMLVVRDSNSQNFYFFIRNRLWKWYKAFDADVFAGQTFDQFAGALQGRFGQARDRNGRLTERGQEKHWLEWQDPSTRLRAIDENRFYGFYCMVFEDKETVGRLDQLRTNTIGQRDDGHALVDAVTGDDSEASQANQDIVDRLTGMIRRRTQAPEGEMGGSSSSSSGSNSGSSSMMSSSADEDPLRGLDF